MSMFTLSVVVVLAVGLWAVYTFNRLVALRNRAEGAWSDIDVQLRRRHDLVGNLVETVKGYAAHERSTLEEVVKARNQAIGVRQAGDVAATAAAEGLLAGQLGRLFALAESYPDLKANQNFLELQRSLGELEEAIQNARRYYNAVVRDLNTRIQSLPDAILARMAGFEELAFFELEDASQAAVPRVDFGAGQ